MPCGYPLTAYRPANGGPVVFQHAGERAYQQIQLPCGQCILCRLEHARQWAVRITHEAQMHEQSSFITLTYADEHVPEHGSLRYQDLRLFWNRLRKEIGKVRYYAVGEYGGTTLRPHYHACIFGHAFEKDRRMLRQSPTLLWTSPQLEACWGLGFVSVGALTWQTAQYTAAYVTKKLNNKQKYVRTDEETGELIALEQPKAYMSLKPAIGARWLEKHGHRVFEHDQVVINGHPQKPPKYYDRWLEKRSEIVHGLVKEARQKRAEKKTPEQTHARARNAHARAENRRKSV